MTDTLAISLHDLAEVTGSGASDAVDLGSLRTAAALRLAIYGTPSGAIALLLETSPDASAWRSVKSLAISSQETGDVILGELDRYLRATWTVTGTTSITWSLAGDAHVVYVEPHEIAKYAVSEFAIDDYTIEERVTACITVTSTADDSLDGGYELPLTAWGPGLRQRCAALAAAFLFRIRGCDKNAAADKIIFDAEAVALLWFKAIEEGKKKPPEIIDSTEDTYEGGPVVESDGSTRDW